MYGNRRLCYTNCMNWSPSAKKFYVDVMNLVPADLKETAGDYLIQYIKLKGFSRQYSKENIDQHLAKIKLAKFKLSIQNSNSSKSTIEANKPKKISKLEERKRRFASDPNTNTSLIEISNNPIIGKNLNLEKSYLRLTGPPNPNLTRPLYILKQTLLLLRNKWELKKDYSFICDQLKSLRQDLSVQGIRDEFTVEVYEWNGRVSLEMSDIGEFNQCQTQLWELYQLPENLKCGLRKDEYKAYRILYLIFTRRKSELNNLLKQCLSLGKVPACIKHAFEVRKAVDIGDCVRVLELYDNAPFLGAKLMNLFIEKVRTETLRSLSKSFRKTISMTFLASLLGMKFEETFNFVDTLIKNVSDDSLDNVFDENEGFALVCTELYPYVEERCSQLSKIDIKGQIH
eukprot:NODE_175_length_14138_cov_1.015314.p5 type:complete len:399 gc:universal NODE_175_length_14138_cov_1.015314:10513-11709(+)